MSFQICKLRIECLFFKKNIYLSVPDLNCSAQNL